MSKKLKPGQPGTKRLVRQYGEQLLCVRYRYDAVRHKRFKTVELIIEEEEWFPPSLRTRPEQMVVVRVNNTDLALKKKLLAKRGVWNSGAKVWALQYAKVQELGLKDKIVEMKVSNSGKVDVSTIGK